MLFKHCEPFCEWWNNRKKTVLEEKDEKTPRFTAQELIYYGCNFDLSKFPNDEDEVLPPTDLLTQYFANIVHTTKKIDYTLAKIQQILSITDL